MGTELVKVGIHGDVIEAAREGSDVWVPLRRVCELLGLNPQSQARAIRGRRWAVGAEKYLAGPDGKSYSVFCVHLDTLPMWLANIHEGKVREEVRGTLVRFQLDAARVLRDHFFGAMPCGAPPPMLPAISGIVRESNALRFDLRRWMFAAAKVHRVHFGRVAGWIAREFGVASYLRLPIPVGVYVRERLTRIVSGDESQPFGRRALPAATGQVVFPPPVGPAQA